MDSLSGRRDAAAQRKMMAHSSRTRAVSSTKTESGRSGSSGSERTARPRSFSAASYWPCCWRARSTSISARGEERQLAFADRPTYLAGNQRSSLAPLRICYAAVRLASRPGKDPNGGRCRRNRRSPITWKPLDAARSRSSASSKLVDVAQPRRTVTPVEQVVILIELCCRESGPRCHGCILACMRGLPRNCQLDRKNLPSGRSQDRTVPSSCRR